MSQSILEYIKRYNQHICNRSKYSHDRLVLEDIEFPIIEAVDYKPTRLIEFNKAVALAKRVLEKGSDEEIPKAMVHMFIEDRQLERLWSSPDSGSPPGAIKYRDRLRLFEAVCSPDHSVYSNWDNPLDLYNVYRNRVIGAYYQQQGLTVVPTVTWSSCKTLAYAFLGLEPEGTYAISCNGGFDAREQERERYRRIYREGMKEFIERLHPTRIIVHGGKELLDADYGSAEVMFFRSEFSQLKNARQKVARERAKSQFESQISERIQI